MQETALNLKELENLSLSANASLAESANATRAVPSVNSATVESAKGADGISSSSKQTSTSSKDGDDELDFLTEMMTTQFHHPHHRAAFHQVGLIHFTFYEEVFSI